MAFIEARFLDRIAANAQRKRRTKSRIIELPNGREVINRLWSQKRREYDVGSAVRTQADYDAILQAFEACDGPADGFRFRDHGDFVAAHANGLLRPLQQGLQVGTAGQGLGVPQFQLVKRYTFATKSSERDITKPVQSGLVVNRNAVAVTPGVAAGQYQLDATSGVVTFAADQERVINAHTPGASHQVTLVSAFSPNFTVGERVFMSGVTGTAASVLNNRAHAITAVSGATLTLSTSTAGLTAGSGTAARFAQAADALTWAGAFDVPVRFRDDEIDDAVLTQQTNGQYLLEAPSIILIEIRHP